MTFLSAGHRLPTEMLRRRLMGHALPVDTMPFQGISALLLHRLLPGRCRHVSTRKRIVETAGELTVMGVFVIESADYRFKKTASHRESVTMHPECLGSFYAGRLQIEKVKE
jgi:hypothetical protein